MQNVEVTINSVKYNVSVSGDVASSHLANGTLLDEVRLMAADQFLGRRDLTKAQRNYWAAVRTVTPEHNRFGAKFSKV